MKLEAAAELERLEERRRRPAGKDIEKAGECLIDLAVQEYDIGLGGRELITLVKRNRTLDLPWNRFRPGSPVAVFPEDNTDTETCFGVVTAINRRSVQIAVPFLPEAERFRLELSPDEVTRQRQAVALRAAAEARGVTGELRKVLLGEREPLFLPERDFVFGSHLNESQQSAIRFALSAEHLAIIHGPPGTGKTTTVVELINQAMARGEKVLACAPSNMAVDNLLQRLIARGARVVRLGHPARVAPGMREHTLDALVESHDDMKLIREMLREAQSLYRQADRYTRAKPAPGSRHEMRSEARQLKAEAERSERHIIEHVLDSADVLCATTSLDTGIIRERQFDWVVIDEACQSTEPGCWIPLLHAKRVVLAGDHCQLPATVLSNQAAREGFGRSLLERLVDHYGAKVTRRLDVQYRMHQKIMQFSSDRFYESTLRADESVAGHRLADLPGAQRNELTELPVLFFDTAGAGWTEELEPDGDSRWNPAEADLILRMVDELQQAGVPASQIAVIAPYAAQVRWLRERCPNEEVEIDTVDGFQGREKEAVLISLVRSNAAGEIGFLADIRRMNVAMTRARRKLIVVGDSATLGAHDFYRSFLEYVESIGAYHTVWEL